MPLRHRKRSPMKGHPNNLRNQHTKIVMLFNKSTGGIIVNYILIDETKRILLPRVESVKFHMLHDVVDFRACVLNNCVYLLGGKDKETGEVLRQVLKFEPHSNKLIECPPMSVPRAKFTAVPLDGRIYVAGGVTRNNKLTARCESFEPLVNTWFKETSLPEGVKLHACVEDPKRRKLYLCGGTTVKEGCSVKMWELFKQLEDYTNPTSCWLWQKLGGPYMSSPVLLPQGLRSHCMLICRDKLYVIGGMMKPTERQKLRILRRQNEQKTSEEYLNEDKHERSTNDNTLNTVEDQQAGTNETMGATETNENKTEIKGANTSTQDEVKNKDTDVSDVTATDAIMDNPPRPDGTNINDIPNDLDDIISIDSGTGLTDSESEHSLDLTQDKSKGDDLERLKTLDTSADVISNAESNIDKDTEEAIMKENTDTNESNNGNEGHENRPHIKEDESSEPIDYNDISQNEDGDTAKMGATSRDDTSMEIDDNDISQNDDEGTAKMDTPCDGTNKDVKETVEASLVDTTGDKNEAISHREEEGHEPTKLGKDTETNEESTKRDTNSDILNQSQVADINQTNTPTKDEDNDVDQDKYKDVNRNKDEVNETDGVSPDENGNVHRQEQDSNEANDNIKLQLINLPKLNIMSKTIEKDKFQFRLDEGQSRLPTIIEESESAKTRTSKGAQKSSAKTTSTDKSNGTVDDKNKSSHEKQKPKKKSQTQFASQEIQAFELSSEKRSERETPWRVHWPCMSTQRVGAGNVTIGNKVYMIGGTNEDQESVHDVEFWHVKKRVWTTAFSLPPGDYSDIDCCLVDMPKSNKNFKLDCSLGTGRWVMW